MGKFFEKAARRLQIAPSDTLRQAELALSSEGESWEALAILGSAHRMRYQMHEAKSAFYLAIVAAQRSSINNRNFEFDLLGRLASLHRDLSEFGTALALLRRKRLIAETDVDEARTDVETAMVLADPASDSSIEDAFQLSSKALAVLEGRDLSYEHSAKMLVLLCSAQSSMPIGRLRADLDAYLQRYKQPAGSAADAHVRWLEGVVRRKLGDIEESRGALQVAGDGLAEHGQIGPAAMCMLDLALLELVARRPSAAARICGGLFPVFKEIRHEAEAWAALRALIEAAGQQAVNARLIGEARIAVAKVRQWQRPPKHT